MLILLFLPLVASYGGFFSRLIDQDDPEAYILNNVFGDEVDPERMIRPIQQTSNYIRHIINSGSDEDMGSDARVVRPRIISAQADAPRSVSRVNSGENVENRGDFSKHPASRILDTAENLFSTMFSFLKPEQVTWHVVHPDREDLEKARTLEVHDDREASGETPQLMEDNFESQAIDRISSFFDKIGASAVAASQLSGPHICVREKSKKIEATPKKSSFRQCKRFEKAVRCVEKSSDKKGGVETARIQECCDGFDTDDISADGCNRESVVMSTRDTLALANSSLVDLLEEVGLSAILDGPERRTLIVPPNSAIDALKKSSTLDSLKEKLVNHIIEGDIRDYEMEDRGELMTLANATLTVSQKEEGRRQKTQLNCVPLVATNIRSSTGLIHYASDALSLSSATVLEYLEGTDRFKTFVSLITPDLERKLRSNDSRYTVFAFSDEAFAALPETVRTNVISKSACVKDLIINHLVSGALCSSELEDRMVVSMGGHVLRVHTMVDASGKHTVHIGTARITEADRFASNGVVHVIDDVILLENLLTWRDHLLTFNKPMLDALSTISMDSEPLTIFVPPANSTSKSLDVDIFMLNHVAENRLILDPAQHQNVTTITNSTFFMGVFKNRNPLTIHINADGIRRKPRVGCSRIINQSIHACNSVLHFLDKPLPVIDGTLRQVVGSRKDLTRFFNLWQESDVAALMDSTSPITVFAPSDDAMSRNQFNGLIKNETLLNAFVRRHIVRGPLCSFDLRAKARQIKYDLIPNEAGEVLHPATFDDQLVIDGSKVQEEEIMTANGVLYVMETPISKMFSQKSILPISFADILGLTPRLLATRS